MLMNLLRRFFVQRKSARLFAEAQRLFQEGAFEEAERAAAECAKLSPELADSAHRRARAAVSRTPRPPAPLPRTRLHETGDGPRRRAALIFAGRRAGAGDSSASKSLRRHFSRIW